jgi:hypothetical protein
VAASGKLDEGGGAEVPGAMCNGIRGLGQTGSAEAEAPKSGLSWHGSLSADDPRTDATFEAIREAEPEAAHGEAVDTDRGSIGPGAVGGGRKGGDGDAGVSAMEPMEG